MFVKQRADIERVSATLKKIALHAAS